MCDNLSILSIFTVEFSHNLHICSAVDFLDSLVVSHPHQLSGLFHCTPPGQTYIVFIIDAYKVNLWETSKVSCSLGAHTFTHTRTHTCTCTRVHRWTWSLAMTEFGSQLPSSAGCWLSSRLVPASSRPIPLPLLSNESRLSRLPGLAYSTKCPRSLPKMLCTEERTVPLTK